MYDSNFPSVKFSSREEYLQYMRDYAPLENEHKNFERELFAGKLDFFDVEGYCSVCGAVQKFRVDYQYSHEENGVLIPNWRERVFCLSCGLNNRARSMAHKIQSSISNESSIYITEQVTNFYKWLSSRYSNITGSEYLGDQCLFGEEANGIRNEDITRLTFSDESFTHVFSFDVLEHVSSIEKAFCEVYRCLKPGGKFIFTVPFSIDSEEHDVYAAVEDGHIVYKKEPSYHGNPLNSDGSLVFMCPGWKLFDDLKALGFAEVSVEKVWSSEYGYFGNNFIFTAVKCSSLPNSKRNIAKSICTVPFTTLQVHLGGEVFLCCPAWTNYYSIGNIFENSFDEIWKGEKARNFRMMMINQDYSLCNDRIFCSHFTSQFTDNIGNIDYLNPKLEKISFCHDDECNLACKMCRKKFRKNSEDHIKKLNSAIEKVFLPMSEGVEFVDLSGNGDVFFSQHYRALAKAISLHNPSVSFTLLTNGIGLTEKNCVELGIINRISSLSVSIDAASESVYRKVRRGGNFQTLKKNLSWFATQKFRGNEIPKYFNFCVQRANYIDIPDFIKFSESYGAIPQFSYFRDEETMDFDKNNILSVDHPEFQKFLEIIHSDAVKNSQHYFEQLYTYIDSQSVIAKSTKKYKEKVRVKENEKLKIARVNSVNERTISPRYCSHENVVCSNFDMLFAIRQCNLPMPLLTRLFRLFSSDIFWSYRLLTGGAVDPSWYFTQYPDVAAGNMNPALHYLRNGWKEGRNPNPWFDTQKYLRENPDVNGAGTNPLLHYCLYGWREGRRL